MVHYDIDTPQQQDDDGTHIVFGGNIPDIGGQNDESLWA